MLPKQACFLKVSVNGLRRRGSSAGLDLQRYRHADPCSAAPSEGDRERRIWRIAVRRLMRSALPDPMRGPLARMTRDRAMVREELGQAPRRNCVRPWHSDDDDPTGPSRQTTGLDALRASCWSLASAMACGAAILGAETYVGFRATAAKRLKRHQCSRDQRPANALHRAGQSLRWRSRPDREGSRSGCASTMPPTRYCSKRKWRWARRFAGAADANNPMIRTGRRGALAVTVGGQRSRPAGPGRTNGQGCRHQCAALIARRRSACRAIPAPVAGNTTATGQRPSLDCRSDPAPQGASN